MSKVSRYRKSTQTHRKVLKQGTVKYSNRFSDKPSPESIKRNRVFLNNGTPLKEKLSKSSFRCFEDWDINEDGIINEDEVESLSSFGYFSQAQMLQQMLLTNTLPKKCYGSANVVTSRGDTISRKVFQKSAKKFESVHRTHSNLKKLKQKKDRGEV